MSENDDRVRDTEDSRGDEELEETTGAEAEEREEGPAATRREAEKPATETAASPTDDNSAPASHAFAGDAGAEERAISRDDRPATAAPAGPIGEEQKPLETAAHRGSDEGQAEAEAAPGEEVEAPPEPSEAEQDDRARPRIILQAGTDEESLRALELCRDKVKELRLHMHPLAARFDDERHVTIFFRADDKVDFRKLVRELSRLLHARIEMRQLGPREQGKLCGLVGKCGYALCCRTFLGQFAQSSIKMAKTQDLALNPMKISGVCGRLLCCLNYEQEHYAQIKSRMPKVNRFVDTEFGRGRVASLNVLRQTVTVQYETSSRELPLDQVRVLEGPGQAAAAEGTSATQRESRSNDTERDSRIPVEPREQ